MKKLISLVLALALVALCAGAAFAADNGTITVTNAEIGKKYIIYKLFDATVGTDTDTNGNQITSYTLPANKDVTNDTFFNTYFELKNGNVTKKAALTEAVLKSAEFKTWAKGFGTKGEEIVASGSTVAFNGLDYGYYFIESYEPKTGGGFEEASGAILTVDSANPAASVIDKNQTNKSEKVIVEGSNKVALNEAGIKENVTFELTEHVKNFDGDQKIYRYQIEDTLDPAFSYNQETLSVTVNGNTLTKDTDYTVTFAVDSETHVPSFTILIPWTDDNTYAGNHLYDNNSTIVVTYTAKLDPTKIEANPGDLNVGATPNKNTAQLKWFKGNENPQTPNGNLPEDWTDTYDTQLTVLKKNNKGEILTGAEFTLTSTNGTKVVLVTENYYEADENGTHYKLKDGTYTTEAPDGNATHDALYDSTTTKYALKTRQVIKDGETTAGAVKTFVGADGKAKFTGLGAGTYTLSETVVPAGYNKVDDITFTITFNPTTKKFASDNEAIVLDAENNIFDTTVINNQGTELPSTGGIGTTIFYILGGLLVIGAAVILVARRKAHE